MASYFRFPLSLVLQLLPVGIYGKPILFATRQARPAPWERLLVPGQDFRNSRTRQD